MREHLGFLKTSSAVVKIAAWIFLLLGVLAGAFISLGLPGQGGAPQMPRLMGPVFLAIYVFIFFLLQLIAKIADLLIVLYREIKKE